MDRTQIDELIKQLKAAGLDEEKIMDVFYSTFQEGKMDRKDLETLANAMGYELTDDFKEDKTLDPINKEGTSEKDLEDLKTIDEGETKEEFKKKVEKVDDTDTDSEDEDEERDEAFKLFRLEK